MTKKTLNDLRQEMERGERLIINQQERKNAIDYERSLLPKNTRYPRKGDLYEAKFDQEITFLTCWAAPTTGSGTGLLHKGERIWIKSSPKEKSPIQVHAIAINYDELEQQMVPLDDRAEPKYGGFYFSISTKDLNNKFLLIATDYIEEN